MSEHPISILSVNIAHSNAIHSSVLQTTTANILLIQEPYWGNLVPSRSDTNTEGNVTWGSYRNDMWETFLPPRFTDRPRVATFVRKSLCPSLNPTTRLSEATACLLLIVFSFPLYSLTLINFYHHVVDHHPNLDDLTNLPIPDESPILLCGDFNTHSPSWSLPRPLWSP